MPKDSKPQKPAPRDGAQHKPSAPTQGLWPGGEPETVREEHDKKDKPRPKGKHRKP